MLEDTEYASLKVGIRNPERNFRKPAPGMIEYLLEKERVGEENALFIGDRPEDKGAAENAKVSFNWIQDFLE